MPAYFPPAGGGAATALAAGLSTRSLEGLRLQSESVTTMSVQPGSARAVSDDETVVLAAERTFDVTTGHAAGDGLAQIDGVDEKGLDNLTSSPITCSVAAGGPVTASASVIPHYNPSTRLGTGTMSGGGGGAVTGSGTKFLSELQPGDVVGNTSKGFVRVASIESDTALTLVNANNFPGGAMTAEVFQIWHSPTINPDSQGYGRVETVTADGITIGVDEGPGLVLAGAGADLTIGGVDGGLTEDVWLAIWLISNGATVALLGSSQRDVNHLALPTGYTAKRRVGWAHWNNTTDNLTFLNQRGDGLTRAVFMEQSYQQSPSAVLTAGAAATWTDVPANFAVPPGARYAYCRLFHNAINGRSNFRERGTGSALQTSADESNIGAAFSNNGAMARIPVDEVQTFQYAINAGTVTVYVAGFEDTL